MISMCYYKYNLFFYGFGVMQMTGSPIIFFGKMEKVLVFANEIYYQ